jgi:hypothetical protein
MAKVEFGRVTIPGAERMRSSGPSKDLRTKFASFVRDIWEHKDNIGLSFRSQLVDHTIAFHVREMLISKYLLLPAACIISAIARGEETQPLSSAVAAIELFMRSAESGERERARQFIGLLLEYVVRAKYSQTARILNFASAAMVYDGEEPVD